MPLEELAEVSLVMLNDHPTQREPLAAVEREIKDKGRQAVIHLADVSLETDVQAMVTETGKRLGSLDVVRDRRAHFLSILFYDSLFQGANAGVTTIKPFLDSESCV